jgi:2-keto-3-deoxy-L-rhamnonate aldolase RhmA
LRRNELKKRIKNGESLLGSWLSVAHPTIAEVMGQAGFDWLIVDMEHGIVGIESVHSLVLALDGTAASPLVRVPSNDPAIIKQVLEIGSTGIMIPQINSAQEAEQAVRAARYPPQGIRGIGCQRAAGFGAWFDDYLKCANEELLIAVEIESVDALRNISAILGVEGVDLIFIGANDLSASMGMFNQPSHPRVQEAIHQILITAQTAKVPVGLMASDPEDANRRIAEGFQFVGIGHDVGHLSYTCRDLCRRVDRHVGPSHFGEPCAPSL